MCKLAKIVKYIKYLGKRYIILITLFKCSSETTFPVDVIPEIISMIVLVQVLVYFIGVPRPTLNLHKVKVLNFVVLL